MKNEINAKEASLPKSASIETQTIECNFNGSPKTITVTRGVTVHDIIGLPLEIAEAALPRDTVDIWEYSAGQEKLAKVLVILREKTDITLYGIEDVWRDIVETDVWNNIVDAIGRSQVEEVFAEADKMIESRRRYLESNTDFNRLLEKISRAFDVLEANFKNIDPEMVSSLMKKLPNLSKMNTDALVDSILKVKKSDK